MAWPELEILEAPTMSAEQRQLLDLHSIVNLLGVLVYEFESLRDRAPLLSLQLDQWLEAIYDLSDTVRASPDSHGPLGRLLLLQAAIGVWSRTSPEAVAAQPGLANLQSLLGVVETRALEILDRGEKGDTWTLRRLDVLRQSLVEVFQAMALNSHGRYSFRYNAAQQGAQDYYVDLRLESVFAPYLWMPYRLEDVVRDLAANARKYTAPGGRVVLAVYQDTTELRVVIEDTGRGIPEDELSRVVEFGYRARNVADIRTFGGGFGLSKAVAFVKRLSGRFWLASQEGHGTRVRFVLPNAPAPVRAGRWSTLAKPTVADAAQA